MLQIRVALFYYKLRQTLLQKGEIVVTNWGSYYKLEQRLLQNRAAIKNWVKFITSWGRYYKLGELLQIGA